MATTLKQPPDRRVGGKLPASLQGLSRRERIATLALAVGLLLLLAVGVGSAVGGGLPFGDDEEARGASGLPSDWAGVEPLLPLAPSLKDIAALKRTAAGEASGVLSAESGRGGGGGALRVRALPESLAAATGGRARVAAERAPRGRPRPAAVGAPAPTLARVPSVRRILATRLGIDLGGTANLRKIIQEDLRGLRGLPIDIDIDIDIDIPRIDPSGPSIPPIGAGPLPGGGPLPLPGGNPLPVGGSLPGVGRGGSVLNLTVVDSRADSRFDVLLVARGRRLLEAYRFRDRDIAGLAAQINLRSGVLVADLLRDGERLARVTAAPLRSVPVGRRSGPLAAGLLAAGESRADRGTGAGPDGPARARSGAKGRPRSTSRGGRRSGSRSAGGGGSSPRFSGGSSSGSGSGSGMSTPRRSTAPRRSTPTPPRRSSPSPEPRRPEPRRGSGHRRSSRPSRGGRRLGHGHGKGRRKHDDDHGRGRGND